MHRFLHPLFRGYILQDTGRLMRQWFLKNVNSKEYTLSQWLILAFLSSDQGNTQSDIVQALETDEAAVLKDLTFLKDKGFIKTEPNPTSPQNPLWQLTAQAKPLLEEIQNARVKIVRDSFAGVSEADQARCQQILFSVHQNLERLLMS